MTEEPLVSIITPTYNSEEFIEETIQSITNQTYQNWELIIVDDNSHDSTMQILNKWRKKEARIRIISLDENRGAAFTRNIAIKNASGRYISFLDSDDLWLPEKLEVQIAFMLENNVTLSFSSYYQISENGIDSNVIIRASPKTNYRIMLRNNYIGCLTAIYDTKKIGKVYMPSIRKRQDWALWLKILKMTDYAFGVDLPLAKYRIRHNSISSNKISLIKFTWKIYRDVENFTFLKSLYYVLRFFFFFFIKKIG